MEVAQINICRAWQVNLRLLALVSQMMQQDRQSRRRRSGRSLAGLLLALALATGSTGPVAGADPVLVSIGTGGKTGVYYLAGGAICGLVNERRWETGVRCLAEASDGSIENLREVRAGTRTFGIVQSDWQAHAVDGTAVFSEVGPDRDLRSVFALFPEAFTVMARPDSGVLGFGDLRGKRVGVGPAGSGGRATMGVVMQAMGWTDAEFAYVSDLPMAETTRALCAGELDAAVFIVAHPNLTVEEMIAACDAMLVPVEAPEIARLVTANRAYVPFEVPSGTYAGQTSPTPTFALTATLVASARTPPAVVETVTAAVVEGLEAFGKMHPAFARLDEAEMFDGDLTAPLHEGTRRYLSARR